MKTSQNLDLANISVNVRAAHEHHWVNGQKLHHIPERVPSAALFHQLWLIQDGLVEVRAGDKKWNIEQGEVCFLPAKNERHIITIGPATWLSLRLYITVFNKFNPLQNVSLPIKWRPAEWERAQMESWMQLVVRQRYMKAAHHNLIVEGLARAVLGLCWPHLSEHSAYSNIHSELPDWLRKTLLRVSTNLTCSVADLAHEAGFSPAQFRRSFRQYVGSTPRDYLRLQRLEATCHFLEHTDLPLRTIAERIGLRDVNHLTKIFKEAYGMPPSTYRTSSHNNKQAA